MEHDKCILQIMALFLLYAPWQISVTSTVKFLEWEYQRLSTRMSLYNLGTTQYMVQNTQCADGNDDQNIQTEVDKDPADQTIIRSSANSTYYIMSCA